VAPVAALAGSVAHFWTVSWDLRGQPPYLAETLPHPSVHLIVEGRRAEVAGVTTGKFARVLRGRGWVFGIKFRPAAFQPLYGQSLSALTDRRVPFRSIFAAAGVRLARALAAAPHFEARVALAEAFLAARLTTPLPAVVEQVRDLVERLAVDRDLVQVEQVARLAGLGLRALQRLFRIYVGVSPKWVIGRYRLHEAAAQLEKGEVGLADLALRLGYFDQAHFIRDFKAMVGRAPGAYARGRTPRRPRS
jgi:AraC-like DNA-binding protein